MTSQTAPLSNGSLSLRTQQERDIGDRLITSAFLAKIVGSVCIGSAYPWLQTMTPVAAAGLSLCREKELSWKEKAVTLAALGVFIFTTDKVLSVALNIEGSPTS